MQQRARHPGSLLLHRAGRPVARAFACACLLLAMALAPRVAICGDQAVLRIGVADALSGQFAVDSPSIGRAAQIAVAQINDRGGVRGMRVVLEEMDDQCNRVKAAEVARRLAAKRVAAVFGHTCTDAMEGALPVYAKAGIVAISPSVTKDDMGDAKLNPWFFRTINPLREEARVAAEFAKDKLRVHRAAFLHDGTTFGRDFAMGVRDQLEKMGVATVLCDKLNPVSLDFSAAVRSLVRSGADTLFIGAYKEVCERILTLLEANRATVNVVGPDVLHNVATVGAIKLKDVKVYAVFTDLTRSRSLGSSLAELHRNWYGTLPEPYFFSAYAAMQALLGALEAAESLTPGDIAKSLREGTWKTPLGRIGFDENGNPTGVETTVYRFREGRFEKCW